MPQAKSIIFVTIMLTFSICVFAQELNENHKKIQNALQQKDYQSVINKLTELQKTNSKIFEANNYDYLLARISEKQGDFSVATANYQNVVNRDSILKEYALWHLSQIMRTTGNLMLERTYLQELAISADKSLLLNAVNKRFARSHLESGNFSEAIQILTNGSSYLRSDSNQSENFTDKAIETISSFARDISREDLVLLAEAFLKNKEPDKAKEVYNELVNNLPKANQPDDFALAGAEGLDKLEIGEDNFGKKAPSLSDDEHYKRALIYQFNRSFPLARIHFEAIAENHPKSRKVPASLYKIARGYGQERNYQKVIEWSEKLQKDFPDNDLAGSALYQTAGAYANLDNTQEAVRRYVKFIDENDDAGNLERAYLNVIDAYRDEKNIKTAFVWAEKTQEKFKGEMGETVALFSQIRIHISQEDWANALTDLNRLKDMKNLGGIRIAGGTNIKEVTFLRGFALEKMGRFQAAVDVYANLEDSLKNYYGWRAKFRTENIIREQESKGNSIQKRINIRTVPEGTSIPPTRTLEFGRKEIWQNSQKTKSHQTIADELLFLGLFDEATPELETALRAKKSNNTGSLSDFSPDTAYTLAKFYRRGDMANRSIGYIEPLLKKATNVYQIKAFPQEHLELLYPKPYEKSLVKYGKEYNVDPRFVLSIMRQESRFQADVKSIAAARGLMQFISTTANTMADEMKINNFKQDDLYFPPTAVRFGSHYINKIFKDFPNQPPAVAASYNGGEDRMMRWFKRANTNDPDRYVPEVIFSQTKDYVYKVMANYRIYQMLYDENLRKKS